MKRKIVFIGASIVNLYGANLLQKKGYNVVIYERNSDLGNDSKRRLKREFLINLGVNISSNEDYFYIKLSDIKKEISNDLRIVFNKFVDHDSISEEYDYIVVCTGHKKVIFDNNKIFSYDYFNDENSKDIFAGSSLENAVLKMNKIVEKIINLG